MQITDINYILGNWVLEDKVRSEYRYTLSQEYYELQDMEEAYFGRHIRKNIPYNAWHSTEQVLIY